MAPNRKQLGIVIGGIIFVLVVGLGLLYWSTLQKVTLTYDTTAVTHLYLHKANKSGGAEDKALKDLASGQSYRLAKGSYILKPEGEKADTSGIALEVGDEPIEKTLDISYSTNYLAQVLATQMPAITAALKASNPKIATLYKINPGYLYNKGEWFGTTLSYTGPDTLSRDTLRVIMVQENGAWRVVTNPPQIIIREASYPVVPEKIVSLVNAIDIGLPQVVKP